MREKCPNTEFFLVRIWTLFTERLLRNGLSMIQKQQKLTRLQNAL